MLAIRRFGIVIEYGQNADPYCQYRPSEPRLLGRDVTVTAIFMPFSYCMHSRVMLGVGVTLQAIGFLLFPLLPLTTP